VDEKARHYLQKAGEQAAARYANEEAIEYFTRALAMTGEHETEERYETLLLREKIFSLKGDRKSQAEDLEMLHGLVQAMNDDRKSAIVALLKSIYANLTSDHKAAVSAAQEAIQLAEPLQETDLAAQGYFLWGDSCSMLGDYDIAQRYLEKALTLSKATNSFQVESKSMRCLGAIALHQSDFDNAKKYFEDSLKICVENGDRIGTGQCWYYLGILSSVQGDYLQARKYYEEGLTLQREIGNRRNEAVALGNLAINHAMIGDLLTALSYFKEGLLISHEVGDREEECRTLGNLGQISSDMGDQKAAIKYYHQALTQSRELGIKRSEAINLYSLGRFSLQSGDYMVAREFLYESLQIFRDLKSLEMEGYLLSEMGLLSGCLGDYQGGFEQLLSAENLTQNTNVVDLKATIQDTSARLLLYLGKNESSQTYCLSTIQMAESSGNKELLSKGNLHLGDVSVEMGDLTAAKGSYNQSIIIRKEMGQNHLISEPQAGLARVAMKEGKLDEALKYVEQIMDYLKDHNLDGIDEPMRIYLTCYQVLQANRDPRAEEILRQAHGILMERAGKITDVAMRQSYLENVAANRGLCDLLSG